MTDKEIAGCNNEELLLLEQIFLLQVWYSADSIKHSMKKFKTPDIQIEVHSWLLAILAGHNGKVVKIYGKL